MHDLRYAARSLGRQPVFTAVAVLTLTIAIAANTAIFSLLYQVLLRPLPFPHAERLVYVNNVYLKAGGEPSDVSIPDYLDRLAGADAIEDATLFTPRRVTVSAQRSPEQLVALSVTPSFFSTLGRQPLIGRTFTRADIEGGIAAKTTILTFATWRSHFGGDRSVVGSGIRLDGDTYTVVGVLPPDFLTPTRDVALLLPFAFTAEQQSDAERGNEFSQMVARLRPGATITQLNAQMDAFTSAVIARTPGRAAYMRTSGFTGRARSMQAERGRSVRAQLYVVQGAVAVVLLIACANLSNLLLMRMVGRQREFAIRTAVGAGGARLVRQLLVEAMLLSGVSGLAGMAAGVLVLHALVRLAAAQLPPGVAATVDLPVALFTLALTALSAIVFGVVPAFLLLKAPTASLLGEDSARGTGSRRTGHVRRALVAAESALAIVLLVGAGLLVRSFHMVSHVDPGFTTDDVLTAEIALPPTRYATADDRRAFWGRLQDRTAVLPGVAACGLVSSLPLSGITSSGSFQIVGETRLPDQQTPHAFQDAVLGDYFRAMGIPLLKGRLFTGTDSRDAPRVVVVDAVLAKEHFGDRNPIGRQLNFGTARNYTIVGVVGAVNAQDLAQPIAEGRIYFHATQIPPDTMAIVLKGGTNATGLVPQLRTVLREVDPEQALARVRSMADWIDVSLQPRRAPALLLSAFGIVALVLAAIGVYGVLAFGVAQRERELGIRQALGADRRNILVLVLRDGLQTTAVGVIAGVAASIALTRALQALLFRVSPRDPVVIATAALLLLGVAAIACLVPARRASRVDPQAALRSS